MTSDGNRLAKALHQKRALRGLSLRAVAEPAQISPTYLQKLERADVRDPSPNILFRLSEQLDLDYGELMKMAGYVVPTSEDSAQIQARGSNSVAHALSAEPLTDSEESALSEYLEFLRSKTGGPKPDA